VKDEEEKEEKRREKTLNPSPSFLLKLLLQQKEPHLLSIK
jgi:hypothetical protein